MYSLAAELANGLSVKIIGIVLAVISLLLILHNIENVNSYLNGFYIQVSSNGYCLVNGEPFDRIVSDDVFIRKNPSWTTYTMITDPQNYDATAHRQYTKEIAGSSDGRCIFTNDEGSIHGRGRSFTPQKNSINLQDRVEKNTLLCDQLTERRTNIDCRFKLSIVPLPDGANYQNVIQTQGWVDNQPFMLEYPLLRTLLATILGFGIPLGLMFLMGSIGGIFIAQLSQGNVDGITGVISQIIIFLTVIIIATAVLGLITGSIQVAITNIDPARYLMYDNMLGRLASKTLGLWGLLLVAGFVPMAFSFILMHSRK